MLPLTADELRVFLHIVAAAVWVGGQITLAGLVPTLRSIDPAAPRQAARRFNRIAWSAFAVLVVTGVWNLFEVQVADATTEYQVTVLVKLLVVAVSGVAAALHARATSRAGLAVGGVVSLLAALAAVLLGVMLRG
ncbi:MAG: CopD family protein [Acidimicrobiales bacterium]